jgi:hypothetical protein
VPPLIRDLMLQRLVALESPARRVLDLLSVSDTVHKEGFTVPRDTRLSNYLVNAVPAPECTRGNHHGALARATNMWRQLSATSTKLATCGSCPASAAEGGIGHKPCQTPPAAA